MAGFGSLAIPGAPFGVMGPQEQAEIPPNAGDKVLAGLISGILGIPKSLIDKSAADAAFTYGAAPVATEADAASANQARSDLAGESAGAMFGVGGASIPFSFMRPGASAGVFGGRLAKTADHEKLAAAEKMAADGHAPTDIHSQTGWFQGADKKWRFEIPDQNAWLKDFGPDRSFGDMRNRIDHPELMAAYPDLGNINTMIERRPGRGEGSYSVSEGFSRPETIRAYGNSVDEAKSVTLHELQHAVQRREGFATGGSPQTFMADKRSASSMVESVNTNLGDISKQMDAARASGDTAALTELKARYDKLMDYKLQDLVPRAQVDPYTAYRNLAGETEARNVQRRMNWDAEKRAEIPPAYSQDVPNPEQIVKFGSLNGPQMAFGGKLSPERLAALEKEKDVWWHGSASGDLRGGDSGLHLGTKAAAQQALEARIGIPAHGKGWGGADEYGKTLLAGQDSIRSGKFGQYRESGFNSGGRDIEFPKEDFYAADYFAKHPEAAPKYPDGSPMPLTVTPEVAPFNITGKMSNSIDRPHEDFRANGYMRGQLKKGTAKNGYYYSNVGEDAGSISAVVPNGSHVQLISDVPVAPQSFGSLAPQMSAKEMLELHRGESVGNRGGIKEGVFYSPDRDFARQFTQSGRDSEILKRYVDPAHVYDPPGGVYAGAADDVVDKAIADARAKGFKAVRFTEGQGNQPSVFVFDRSALKGKR